MVWVASAEFRPDHRWSKLLTAVAPVVDEPDEQVVCARALHARPDARARACAVVAMKRPNPSKEEQRAKKNPGFYGNRQQLASSSTSSTVGKSEGQVCVGRDK